MPDIDDPFKPSRRHRAPAAAGRRQAGRRRPVRVAADGPARRAPPMSSRSPAAPASCSASGLNPLVQAASPLLLLAGPAARHAVALRMSPGCGATRSTRSAASRSARASPGVPNEIVLAARYALCAALDEAVLSTPWGAQSEWAQQPLLVALHREAWGGEKFFEMLDRISQDPARHIDLMELQYLCLAFGFAGKYQVQSSAATSSSPTSSTSSTGRSATIAAARRRPSCRCGGAGSRIGAIR